MRTGKTSFTMKADMNEAGAIVDIFGVMFLRCSGLDKRILIVDDDENLLEGMKRLFSARCQHWACILLEASMRPGNTLPRSHSTLS